MISVEPCIGVPRLEPHECLSTYGLTRAPPWRRPGSGVTYIPLLVAGHLKQPLHRVGRCALDRAFERMQGSDAELVQEPTEQPYGVRDCAFRDPAGNLVRIQELR